MELHYKILVVYLCLGALYITLKLRFVGRGKYEKFKNVVDEVSVITPEKMQEMFWKMFKDSPEKFKEFT